MAEEVVANQMMPEKAKKRVKRGTTFSVNLDEDVLEKIISFFPIKDATRCGQLSKRFKNTWRFCRNLVFDLYFARGRTKGNQIRVINRVFNQHLGPKINTFHLYFDPTDVEVLVEYWLKRVILKGVEELDLDFTQGDVPFKLPSHLFEVESIRYLKLTCCRLDLPTKLKGLSFLKTLILRRVNIKSIQIATIFANCLLLEGIELLRCFGSLHLNIFARHLKKYKRLVVGNCENISIAIDAPTLSTLSFRGEFCHFGFYSPMLNLDEVVLNFTSTKSSFPRFYPVNNLMMGISYVKILKVSSAFLELGEFPFVNGLYWKMHGKHKLGKCNPTFQRLKKILVKGFKFEIVELEMLRFFLKKAKFLESVALVPSKNCRSKGFSQANYQITDQLFRAWRASPNAKAIPRQRLLNILDREARGTGQAIEKESRQYGLHTFGAKGIFGGVVKCIEIGKNTEWVSVMRSGGSWKN
ncbi:putative FBD-associated F-box protein At1g61330 [Actinidia eriantha]|uniref:putative FBD-associated F-box protein At1g61330 n=1 Tax=Actinidia eriantha TaxID=165200 RepID=UPI00258A3736|nr:putative FBD-associated F-box protein At1g61330 [Actinidia eriantha]